MKILVLRNLGAGLPPYREGQTVPDCPDSLGKALIGKGLATMIDQPKATKRPAESKPLVEEAGPEPIIEPQNATPDDPLAIESEPSGEASELDSLGKSDLIKLAEDRGVVLKNKATKAEIIEALQASDSHES